MSIFVETEHVPANAERGYPKLRVAPSSGLVVLFTGFTTGTVIDPGRSVHDVGYHGHTWTREVFEDFTGKVTLKND